MSYRRLLIATLILAIFFYGSIAISHTLAVVTGDEGLEFLPFVAIFTVAVILGRKMFNNLINNPLETV